MQKTGLFSWYRNSNKQERKTFWACFTGWTLDSFDAQMFSFLLPAIIATWQISKGDAGILGTAALLSSAVGGWAAGILSDRFGRVRILMFTIAWFAAFSVLAGFASNFSQLLILRIGQGLGFGGEWAVGAALMAEVIAADKRGKALGLVQSGFSIGWALASVISMVILAQFPPEIAWRVALWFTIVPALIVLVVRRGLKEPSTFIERQKQLDSKNKASILSVFRSDVRRHTILACIVITGFQGSSYAIINWIPTLLKEARQLTPSQIVATMLIMTGGAFIGFIVNGYACDRFGRRATLLVLSLAAWLITAAYCFAPIPSILLTGLGFFVGFTVNGMFAGVGPFLSELFPTEIRASCMAFSYNIGKSIGAFAVTLVGVLTAYLTLSQAIGVFCFIGYAMSSIALLFLPETAGADLKAIHEETDRGEHAIAGISRA